MNENIDLVKILKDYPEGFELYSSVAGKVTFVRLNLENSTHPIIVRLAGAIECISFCKNGQYFSYSGAECCLFPSKEMRDWSKFTAPWYKKKFDPKSLIAYDNVIVRGTKISEWRLDFLSHTIVSDGCNFYVCTSGGCYKYCIPYNDDTKHLTGTIEEAPEYYRYWED